MMGPGDIRDLVASLFIMLKQNTFILFRIEFLVVLVTLVFFAMFILDFFRRYIHSSTMKAIFSFLDAVSDSIVVYLLGAMQTAPFKNQLFPVWALVLVIFRYSVDFISGYGVPDNGGRRYTEWRNLVKLLGSAFLNKTRGSRFAKPLWSLWALQILRSGYRFRSHALASNSTCHGMSSEIVSEHMREDDENSSKWKDCKPGTMVGCRYLVYGESVNLHKPQYVLRIEPSSTSQTDTRRDIWQRLKLRPQGKHRSPPITLDKIWTCQRHLLRPDKSDGNNQEEDLKDLSLAFALSRVLRCRLEDVKLPEETYGINRELVERHIIKQPDAKRGFRVLELQLSFINDYFNTRYPMVFWLGLHSLYLSLLQSVLTFGVVIWLSVDIRKVYKPPDGELAHLVQGFNVDMIITWVFMGLLMVKEVWEIVTYILSDWTRLFLVCAYANQEDDSTNKCMERLISSIFKSKIIDKSWHGLIDQYVFVQSYHDRPKVWNWIHKMTTGMVPKKNDGAKLGSAIDVPECVKSEILEKLPTILKQARPQVHADPNTNYTKPAIIDGLRLDKDIMTLHDANRERMQRYGWACTELQTSSHVILVWHIATSLCEMALAKKYGIDLGKPGSVKPYLINVDKMNEMKNGEKNGNGIQPSKPGFLCSLLSCFTNCCSSKPYIINAYEMNEEKSGEENYSGIHSSNPGFLCSLWACIKNHCSSKSNEKLSELQRRYIIANSLSRYCAYLLVSKPDLIPDSFLVPQMVFQQTVKSARDGILKYCDSLESRYNKLSLEAYKAAEDYKVKKGENVVKQGALLGKLLLDHESEEGCWEILAGVWTELLIHIAPTWNAEAHKKYLGSGGEFITNIWALLWHCGIEKSDLWPVDDVSKDNAPTDPQDNDAGNNHNDTVEEMQQAGTYTGNHQNRNEVHGEAEILEIEDPEANNIRIRTRGI